MPRPKEFDPDQALDSAMETFWEQGFEATSVQDLVDRMGINRFSLYDAFGNKHDLFLKVLDRYRDQMGSSVLADLAGSDQGVESIRAYFTSLVDYLASPAGRKACFMVNSMAELAGEDRTVRSKCMVNVKSLETAFQVAVERAQALGEIDADRDARELGEYLATNAIGLNVLAKADRRRARLARHVELVLGTLR